MTNHRRSDIILGMRQELVGPADCGEEVPLAIFHEGLFKDTDSKRGGPLAWRPSSDSAVEEVLYYSRETPYRKYGVGMLKPLEELEVLVDGSKTGADTLGVDLPEEANEVGAEDLGTDIEQNEHIEESNSDDPEINSSVSLGQSTVAITFCVEVNSSSVLRISMPNKKRFAWQAADQAPCRVNGVYVKNERTHTVDDGRVFIDPVWKRYPLSGVENNIDIPFSAMIEGKIKKVEVPVLNELKIKLQYQIFPRKVFKSDSEWLVTVVLENISSITGEVSKYEQALYQTYFEASVLHGSFKRYPESEQGAEYDDSDDKSLKLLYRDAAVWGIGHGCAAGWEEGEGVYTPDSIFADVFPSVELPSMTPDITIDGVNIELSMRAMSSQENYDSGLMTELLASVLDSYAKWIEQRKLVIVNLEERHHATAKEHMDRCDSCLERMRDGLALLENDKDIEKSFRLMNLAMLLQQIGTKQLKHRKCHWDKGKKRLEVEGESLSPAGLYNSSQEKDGLGKWRAFQLAFILMSLKGVSVPSSEEREAVDLIWFPTGGGKTEAYLGVAAFHMFHQRFLSTAGGLRRDGTNVLLRYTLRMLTTQQFQRAGSLIVAMEYMRRVGDNFCGCDIPGIRFSLGLWLGSEGSPNTSADAVKRVRSFGEGKNDSNPVVLTECPWCRSAIGRVDINNKDMPRGLNAVAKGMLRISGVHISNGEVLLRCPDIRCEFGKEELEKCIPVEVVDERIYEYPPSMVIGTADKFAMLAYRPKAGRLFGRKVETSSFTQIAAPPSLIIQDELHLISGPLGTMYGLYETIIEELCTDRSGKFGFKPKIIASTATIKGAEEQVTSLYSRNSTVLFPPPGLDMGDSFFGKYARDKSGKLSEGRLYLGICAKNYSSVFTTQVRTFSRVAQVASELEDGKDPWWTLLAFYNSIRELGGAKTLFDSDIVSRLKYLFNRKNTQGDNRRYLNQVRELTGRLSQSELVNTMNALGLDYGDEGKKCIDAVLASNIIEVGVDIDRLSLMAVVGQPKTTSTYIQVTGRVGRRWWERPGLILTIYNPNKVRDVSHYEQFHSYHRRLYERVEPTSATPFAQSAIERGMAGAMILYARQQISADVHYIEKYLPHLDVAYELLRDRCDQIQSPELIDDSKSKLTKVYDELRGKWRLNPQAWEEFPQKPSGEYLMLWPGQYASPRQRARGVTIPSSMRSVDKTGEIAISHGIEGEGQY